MRDMMADLTTSVPQWRQALDGDGPWDELFAGKESIATGRAPITGAS